MSKPGDEKMSESKMGEEKLVYVIVHDVNFPDLLLATDKFSLAIGFIIDKIASGELHPAYGNPKDITETHQRAVTWINKLTNEQLQILKTKGLLEHHQDLWEAWCDIEHDYKISISAVTFKS
jgi:hypothetical protein